MKTCTKCKIEKELFEFTKDKTKKDGFSSQCKSCKKEWRETNKDYFKKWRETNKDYDKQYRKNNEEKLKLKRKKWEENNKEYGKKYKDKRKKYYEENKEKINEKKKNYNNNRRKKDFFYKLNSNIRTLISNSLKRKNYKKNTKTELILGCKKNEFKLYLESKFESWMNWDNYGNPKDGILELNKSWDLDHIIPLASAKTEEDILKLNHYTNLQPLCSYTNRFIKNRKPSNFSEG